MKMDGFASLSAVLVILSVSLAAPASAADEDAPSSLTGAMTGGDAHVLFRYRYEFVDQDFNVTNGVPFDEKANASTLRVRLNYATKSWQNWSGFVEFDYVAEVLLKDFNNTVDPGTNRNQYPVVADPKGADLNQLYLDYDGFSESKLRFGRQRILLDNQRFVGGVGWRQNEQTYDSVSGTFKGIANTELFYGYVATVNRIFGERSPIGREHTNTHLLNAKIRLSDDWSIVPYGYYIDNNQLVAFSTVTFGARVAGKIDTGSGKINLVGEIATQSDAASAPVGYTAQYYHFDLLWALTNGWSFGLGFESLGGDSDASAGYKAFRTPLATLHAFQGWADQFLATPGAGVDDIYAKATYKFGKWNFTGVYHDFSAQSGSASWGKEFDASARRSLGDRYAVLFKAAFFRADDVTFSDVTKFWIMLTANY